MVVLRRVCLVLGLLYYYRGITMFITVLPKPDTSYVCAPKLNHTITFLGKKTLKNLSFRSLLKV